MATRRRIRRETRASCLAGDVVVALCEEWFAGVASDVLVATTEKGFMGGIRTVDDLVSVESVARAKLAKTAERMTSRRASICSGAADAWATLAEEPTSHRARTLLAATLRHGGLRTAADAALQAVEFRAANVGAVAPSRGGGDVGR